MIYKMLFDWQKKVVDKFVSRKSFGLFLDMGTGKTPISLAFAEQNECTKVIIVTINPKALESKDVDDSWFGWASKSKMNYTLNDKWEKDFGKLSHDVFVINYESLFKRTKEKRVRLTLRDNVMTFIQSCVGHNVAIIIDESHKMKSLSSMQTKSINEIRKLLRAKAKNVYSYLLTGTPFTKGYIDLYSQLKFLGYPRTKGHFIDRYCELGNVPGLLGWQQPIVGYKNLSELFDVIHHFAITIKSDEISDLPEQIHVQHKLPMSHDFKMFLSEKAIGETVLEYYAHRKIKPSVADLHKYSVRTKVNNPFYRNIAHPDLKWLADTSGTMWLRARQLSIGFQGNSSESVWFDKRRIDRLHSFLQANEDNYLIFYNYTPELLELYQVCDKLGYNIDVYCGEVKSLHFYETYRSQTESEKLVNNKNVIIANFASGSTGMNWQHYSKCIIFSIPLYKDYEQAIKRIHRTGQKETTVYHWFIQSNWLDISMRESLIEGTEYSEKMFEEVLSKNPELLSDV